MSHKSADQNDQDEDGEDELEIGFHPAGHFHAAPFIDFFDVIVKAPAEAGNAEEEVHQGTAGEEEIADQEVFAVQHVPSSDEVHAGEDIVSQNAGDGEEEDNDKIHQHRFLSCPAEIIHGAGNEVFKYRRHRGEAGKGHEHEEESAPEPACSHVGKDFRQGNENQGGALVGMHVVGKAGRENDKA